MIINLFAQVVTVNWLMVLIINIKEYWYSKEDRYVTEIVTDVNNIYMHTFLHLAYQCHVYMTY